MQLTVALSLLSTLASANAAETVLGAFIFHRHGDRTPKSLAPSQYGHVEFVWHGMY